MRKRKTAKQITTNKYTGVIKSAPKETVSIHNLSREGFEALQIRAKELDYTFGIEVRPGILDYLITVHVLTINLY